MTGEVSIAFSHVKIAVRECIYRRTGECTARTTLGSIKHIGISLKAYRGLAAAPCCALTTQEERIADRGTLLTRKTPNQARLSAESRSQAFDK